MRDWTRRSSRTSDPVGLLEARKELQETMLKLKLRPQKEFTDERSVWTWETEKGMKEGILIIGHLDIPLDADVPFQSFRRTPDRLFGEGTGSSRGPLVMMEFALNALRSARRLKHLPLGVLFYSDEGQDTRYSQEIIQAAAAQVQQVILLRPGIAPNCVVNQRRGLARFRLFVEGEARRLGQPGKRWEASRWTNAKIEEMIQLTSRKEYIAVGLVSFEMKRFPLRLPHICRAELLVNYLEKKNLQQAEKRMREILGRDGFVWTLEKISERPPLKETRKNQRLFKKFVEIAQKWDIPLEKKSSLWPSAAGLVPEKVAVACGIGPVAQDLYTPQESINRISLLQRTLLLAQYLLSESETILAAEKNAKLQGNGNNKDNSKNKAKERKEK